jgi:hypothetical protein
LIIPKYLMQNYIQKDGKKMTAVNE